MVKTAILIVLISSLEPYNLLCLWLTSVRLTILFLFAALNTCFYFFQSHLWGFQTPMFMVFTSSSTSSNHRFLGLSLILGPCRALLVILRCISLCGILNICPSVLMYLKSGSPFSSFSNLLSPLLISSSRITLIIFLTNFSRLYSFLFNVVVSNALRLYTNKFILLLSVGFTSCRETDCLWRLFFFPFLSHLFNCYS